jgi:hypothetical protein
MKEDPLKQYASLLHSMGKPSAFHDPVIGPQFNFDITSYVIDEKRNAKREITFSLQKHQCIYSCMCYAIMYKPRVYKAIM